MDSANINSISMAKHTIEYICSQCNRKNVFGSGAHIRCQVCGCHIMYKKRTERVVIVDAR